MSLRNFPPNEMTSTVSADESTPFLSSTSLQQKGEQLQQNQPQVHNSLLPLICVILAVVLERITYYGILANLVLFSLNDLEFSSSVTIAITFLFSSLAWLMSTIGGYIGDSYSGRFNAVWGSLSIYTFGTCTLFIAAYLAEDKVMSRCLALIALVCVPIGEGAYKANVTAFGADQLQGQNDTQYRRFFNWYYWSINVGSFITFTAIVYVEQISFTIGFGILVGCIVLAAVFFCSCRSRYICVPPSGNILKKMYEIIKEARRKKRNEFSSSQHCPGMEDFMPIKSWLDKAMMKYGGSYLDSDVEEVKAIGRIVVIFAVLIPYWTIYAQMNSTFLLQGLHMQLGNPKTNIKIPPAWLSIANIVVVLALIPIMDKIVYPWLDRKGWHLSVYTRISVGFFFAVASMIVAGIVECHRSTTPHGDCYNQTVGVRNYTACLTIAYQVPQYAFIGISEVFASVGALEFAYREAPVNVQSLVMGLFFFVQSLGNLLGLALFTLCSIWKWTPPISVVVSSGKPSKLDGRLYLYFFLLAGIQFLTWLAFLVVSFRSPSDKRNPRRTLFSRLRPAGNTRA